MLPKTHVKPDVRVMEVVVAPDREQRFGGNTRRHLDRLDPACSYLGKHLGHLTFEMETAVDDHLGRRHRPDIAGRGFVEVGIDSRTHQGLQLDDVTADGPREITDDGRRCHDSKGALRRVGRPASTATDDGGQKSHQKK